MPRYDQTPNAFGDFDWSADPDPDSWQANDLAGWWVAQANQGGAYLFNSSLWRSKDAYSSASQTPAIVPDDERGAAFNFDGVDDVVTITSTNLPSQFGTISAWVKPNVTNDCDIIFGGVGGADFRWTYPVNRLWGFFIAGEFRVSANGPTNGVWTHILETYGPAGSVLYYNGRVQGTNGTQPNPFTSTGFWLGGQAGGNYYQGLIDDFRIYNHPVTAEEALELYDPATRYDLYPRRRRGPVQYFLSGPSTQTISPPAIASEEAVGTAETYNATSIAYPTSNAVDVTGWTNPTQAYTDDGTYATATPAKSSVVATRWGDFNLDTILPSNAIVRSATVEVQWKVSATNSAGYSVGFQPYVSGSAIGSEFVNTTLGTADTIQSQTFFGITRSDLLNSTFKVRVRASRLTSNNAYTASLDYIKVTVVWTVPVVPTAIGSGEDFGTATVASAGQTITAVAIASTEAFGTTVVTPGAVSVSPPAIAPTEAFGTTKINLNVVPTAIVSLETFGVSQLNLRVVPTAIASLEIFGTTVLTPGAVTVTLTGIASGEVLGSVVLTSVYTLAPPGITSLENLGLAQLHLSMVLTAIGSLEVFGTTTVSSAASSQTVTLIAIASTEVFGTAQLNLFLVLTGIASGEVLEGVVVTPGSVTITLTGIGSLEIVGTAQLNLNIVLAGITSQEGLGLAKLNLSLVLTGIASGEVFGATKLNLNLVLVGIVSGEFFGLTKINLSLVLVGISSLEVFGTSVLTTVYMLALTGISSLEVFGQTTIQVYLLLVGVSSQEIFGVLAVLRGVVTVSPSGIVSLEAFGTSIVSAGSLFLSLSGIASTEAFGVLVVTPGSVSLTLTGIVSLETFGLSQLNRSVVVVGIVSSEVFGTSSLNLFLVLVGIVSLETFGLTVVVPGSVTITLVGITSAEAFGAWVVSSGGTVLSLSGIPSLEVFGLGMVTTGVVSIQTVGIVSTEVFGIYVVSSIVTLNLFGISSLEVFGLANLLVLTGIYPLGVSSLEVFGNWVVTPGSVSVFLTGLVSSETFGTSLILGYVPNVHGQAVLGDTLLGLVGIGDQLVELGIVGSVLTGVGQSTRGDQGVGTAGSGDSSTAGLGIVGDE